jgi:tetratricopeptide (TPR) repeat protein
VTEAVATEIAEVDADRLSLILGHELAHLTLEHSLLRKGRRGEFSEVLESVHARDEEFAADRLGVTIALRAGFSYEAIVATFQRYLDRGANVYDAVHALGSDHPSWKERLAKIDEGQSALWSSMSAFDSGVLFLLVEQYAAAERAFRAVVGDFPDASEAWANLGYSLLMQYCDALDPGDLALLGVGHVLVGGFYRRPATLEARVRGIDRKLWTAATIALSQALKLEPGLTLARANLGVAYLVGPDPSMATEGWRLLAAAADSAEMDPMLEPSMRMSILVNASVAGQTAGDTTAASAHLERVSELGQAFGPRGELPTPVSAAVIFNEARILERRPGRESEAVNLYRTYLEKASPSSVWWELAYDRYVTLSQTLSIEPTPVETLRRTNEPAFRPVTSVELPAGEGISLSESVATVESRLGDAARIPVTPGGEIVRLSYPERGLEILASDYVIGITQVGNVAPGLSLRPVGLGSATLGSLAPGMSVKEVDALLASVPFERREIVEKGVLYRFYRPLGVAVRVKEDRVTEVVVVHIPESG